MKFKGNIVTLGVITIDAPSSSYLLFKPLNVLVPSRILKNYSPEMKLKRSP